ncbi:MAG: hypothetical protein MUC36_06765 [Planctomycetes bacterium]|nr:hypothetical protein [Planctomycetota bacterium]
MPGGFHLRGPGGFFRLADQPPWGRDEHGFVRWPRVEALLDAAAAPTPTPEEFAAYLRQHGWRHEASDSHWSRFTKPAPDAPYELEIPLLHAAGDYPRAARSVLENLSLFEQRDASQILRDVKAVSLDIVRIGIVSAATRDGRIPVEAGHRVFEAARDLLLAAACAVDNPRAAFPNSKTEQVRELVRNARFGRSEIGSYVVTIECEVPPHLTDGQSEDADQPMERRTSARLADAVAALGAASRESAGSGSFGPFEQSVASGVSANLCEAIADILQATEAESIWTSVSFASSRPRKGEPPARVQFSQSSLGLLREAARQLRASATYPSFELVGVVKALHSSDPAHGGTAIVISELDGRWRRVSTPLSATDYVKAIRAHEQREMVRCIGDLTKAGRGWSLQNVREFEFVPES